jgi:hypothetical protein
MLTDRCDSPKVVNCTTDLFPREMYQESGCVIRAMSVPDEPNRPPAAGI